MNCILLIGIILVMVSLGYFILGLFDLMLDKVLKYVAKNMYRKQTQRAIAEVLNKP